jgi:hypothetical protein
MSPSQANALPAAATQATSTTGNVATDNTSIERILVPETNQRDTPEDSEVAITRKQAKPIEKETPKRKAKVRILTSITHATKRETLTGHPPT